MNAHVALGLLLAIGSAIAINSGYYVQHGAATALPPLSLRRPLRSLALLFRDVRWIVGFATGIGGWVLYVIALKLAPLSVVQAASAGGIALLAALVGELSRRESAGVVVAAAGLVLLGLSLVHAAAPSGRGAWLSVTLWMVASLAAAALAAGPVALFLAGGAGLGIAAGVLYAAGDVGTKAAVVGGARLAFAPALLACHGLAFVALQLGFQRGGALATAGLAVDERPADRRRHDALRRVAAGRCAGCGPDRGVRLRPRRRRRPRPAGVGAAASRRTHRSA